jgi:hypothetical protein
MLSQKAVTTRQTRIHIVCAVIHVVYAERSLQYEAIHVCEQLCFWGAGLLCMSYLLLALVVCCIRLYVSEDAQPLTQPTMQLVVSLSLSLTRCAITGALVLCGVNSLTLNTYLISSANAPVDLAGNCLLAEMLYC